jgi:quinol monooxygenase YgiN
MVHAMLRMVLPSDKQGEVLQVLSPMVERVRLEAGCLACNVYQDVRDRRVIMFEEVWRCEDEMERHLRSEQYRNVLLVMEMALEPPEIRFNEVSRSTGVETIERARLGTPEA